MSQINFEPLPSRPLHARDILQFAITGHSQRWLLGLLLSLVIGLSNLVLPLVLVMIFDTIIPAGDTLQFVELFLLFVGIILIAAVALVIQQVVLVRITIGASHSFQIALMDRLLKLPLPFFRSYSSAEMVERLHSIDAIRAQLATATLTILLITSISVFNLLVIFILDVPMGLLALLMLSLSLAVAIWIARMKIKPARLVLARRSHADELAAQIISTINRLHLAGAEARAHQRWEQAYKNEREAITKLEQFDRILNSFYAAWLPLSLLVIFAAVNETALTTGAFLIIVIVFVQVTAINVTAGRALGELTALSAHYERLVPILQAVPETNPNAEDPGILSGDIRMEGVSFHYSPDSRPVLDTIDFHAKPGEYIALVGPSGSGKTTLLRLLLGFEQPTTGTVYYNNRNLATLDIDRVRAQIGAVFQANHLPAAAILTTIMGEVKRTDLDDAWEAARIAGLEPTIRQLPADMYTIVSEDGTGFSSGQRQQLLIARAVAHKPGVLILDEAMSAIDKHSEHHIMTSLEGVGMTRLMATHRLSSTQKADRIYVLNNGRIVQQGTYQELLNQPGLFQDLAHRNQV